MQRVTSAGMNVHEPKSRRDFLGTVFGGGLAALAATPSLTTLHAEEPASGKLDYKAAMKVLEGKVKVVTTVAEIDEFFKSEAVKKSNGVLVMMTADWCQPCQVFKTALAQAINDKGGLEKTAFSGMKILLIDVTSDHKKKQPDQLGALCANSTIPGITKYFITREGDDNIPRIALLKSDGSAATRDNGNGTKTLFTGNNFNQILEYAKEMNPKAAK